MRPSRARRKKSAFSASVASSRKRSTQNHVSQFQRKPSLAGSFKSAMAERM